MMLNDNELIDIDCKPRPRPSIASASFSLSYGAFRAMKAIVLINNAVVGWLLEKLALPATVYRILNELGDPLSH
ncbi:hypothetical protein SLA2020_498720 [Shorea laevis]